MIEVMLYCPFRSRKPGTKRRNIVSVNQLHKIPERRLRPLVGIPEHLPGMSRGKETARLNVLVPPAIVATLQDALKSCLTMAKLGCHFVSQADGSLLAIGKNLR